VSNMKEIILLIVGIITLMVLLLIVVPTLIGEVTFEDSDSHSFTHNGYFSSYRDTPYDYWFTIDGDEHYYSDTGDFDIDKYVGHNVSIEGYGGCGNSIIIKITNLDTGESWTEPGADLTLCYGIIVLIIAIVVGIVMLSMYTEYRKEKKKKE